MDPLLSKILKSFHLLSIHQVGSSKFPLNPSIPILLILCLVIATASYYSDLCFDNSTNVHMLLDFFQGYGPLISYLVIILEGFKSRKSVEKIWKLLQEILEVFRKELNASLVIEFRRILRRFAFFAIAISVLFMAVEFTIILGVKKKLMWFYNRLVGQTGLIGCRFYLLYFILHVRIFRFLLESLLEYQKRINFKMQHCTHPNHLPLREKQGQMQMHLRRVYNKLVLMNWLINDAFKYSLVVIFVTNVVCLAISWIWNYISFRFGTTFALGMFLNLVCRPIV